MPDGVIIHREQIPPSGTWSPRPALLAGITPTAVFVYGSGLVPIADGSLGADAAQFQGFADGSSAVCNGVYVDDGSASSNTRKSASSLDLIYLTDADNVEIIRVDSPTFVSGGFDATVTTNVNGCNAVCVFFYGDDWQASTFDVYPATVPGTVVVPSGFTGTNDNQIVFVGNERGTTAGRGSTTTGAGGLGLAFRQGASGPPAGQCALISHVRDGRGTAEAHRVFDDPRVMGYLTNAYNASYEIIAIRDNELEIQSHENASSTRRRIQGLILSTGSKKCWVGEVDSLTTDGDFIVNGPNFQPVIAGLAPSQATLSGENKDADVLIGGVTHGTSSNEFSEMWSFEDGVGFMVAKSKPNSQFLDVPQDDGSEGWKSGANDFSLTPTGFRVDNVVIDGGGGGAPLTARKWIAWAIEGLAGPPTINLDIDDSRHGRRLDSVDVQATYTLIIDGLRHGHRLDECDLQLSEAIGLIIESLSHGHSIDAPIITPTWTLIPDALRHGHTLDECAVYWRVDVVANSLIHAKRLDACDVEAAPEIVIDIAALSHGRRLDGVLLTYESSIAIDDLRHGHTLDAPDVSALMGLLTSLARTDAEWRINAGQSLENSAGVDTNWHVVEAIFDGAGSILAIDGSPVAGNAGVRELMSLTLGAEVDGTERLTGDIGELRIYKGALTQAQRDKIRAELQGKWL